MRILYLCHRIPFPPDKGDKIRSYHEVEHLARRHEVHLFTLVDDAADLLHVQSLRKLVHRLHVERLRPRRARLAAFAALLRGEPLSVAYFRHPGLSAAVRAALARERFDVALVFSSAMAPYLDGWSGPRVLDYVDVDSAKWLAYAARGGVLPARLVYAREGRTLRALEAREAERAELTVVCSPREEEELRSFCRPRRLVTVPNGTDVDFFAPGPSDVPPFDLVFTGAMDYRANVDAIVWLAEEVFPRVRAARPDARLAVVGSNPAPAVTRLARRDGIEVTGRVPDVRPWLRAARLAVAPLRVARGIQNKVLEALACGCPVVATGAALGGIGAAAGVVVEEEAARFADTVLRLLADHAERERLGAAGRAWVVERFRWDIRLGELERLLEQVASRPAVGAVEEDDGFRLAPVR